MNSFSGKKELGRRPNARATAEVMAQVLRTTANLAFTEGLNPAQWAALRYFSQANATACSVVAFARHHGTTKGTASQTIAALQKKGLLDRQRSETDRRSISLALTDRGRSILTHDPLNEVAAAIASLSDPQHGALADGLDQVLRTLLVRRAQRSGDRAGDPAEELGGDLEDGGGGEEGAAAD
ncbi:MarR family transcriptional regulator [Azospirillum rugosum]|uniref:DNA-binding MarR family transcriptional regulator n=1 Tax=Azospirillum rugosum TaxID=416170 RepID=A0ABS4SSK9_9PROT|nr:MarR family transcriptional regulator [Azospirillum rugosum]MBP2295422.1 DNA-binding MarR family transcriptional regulator [Azospirillum rugosum]MDQ0528301.1 DNA-binding MarR family transcriptional regulator [Azospirillum rugosum]